MTQASAEHEASLLTLVAEPEMAAWQALRLFRPALDH